MTSRVRLAGGVSLETDSRTVHEGQLGGRQARLVLAVLAVEGRRVRREELAEALWGERPPRSWETALRGIVSRLRSALEAAGLDAADVIRTDAGTYELRLPGLSVDVPEAAGDADRAEDALGEGRFVEAINAARSAVDVTSRPVLDGEDSPWVRALTDLAATVRVRALETLSHALVATGDAAGAVGFGEEAVRSAPFRESAHHVLMQAHAAFGNRAEALLAYERCRAALVTELGVDPSAQTQTLYLELLRDERPAGAAVALPSELAAGDATFVGREDTVALLQALLARARESTLQAVFVSGEPGIGKTRLAAEVARRAHENGAVVLYGRCDADSVEPYAPLAQALRHRLGHVKPADIRARLGAEVDALSPVVPSLGRHREAQDEEAGRFRLFEAITRVVVWPPPDAPVLLVVDDMHWVDRPTLALLRHLVRSAVHEPIVVMGTFRQTDLGNDHPLHEWFADIRRDVAYERVELEGLDRPAVAELVGKWSGQQVTGDLVETVHSRTRGNPFFVGEVLRHLAETGALGLAGVQASAAAVPLGIRDVVAGRLSRLGPQAREALQIAAVLGHRFDLDPLAAIAAASSRDLLVVLEEAIRARLVEEVSGPPGSFAFVHAVVRDTVYEGVSHARRALLHGRALDVLASSGGHPPAELALHAERSGERERAASYHELAAALALASFAYDQAAEHYSHAVGAARDELELCRLQCALADALWRAGRTSDARSAAREASTIARRSSVPDPVLLAHAALCLVGAEARVEFDFIGVVDREAVSALDDAIEALGDDQDALRARLLAALARELYFEPDASRRESLSARAVDLARGVGDDVSMSRALLARHFVLTEPGFVEARFAAADEVVSIARRLGNPDLEVRGLYCRTVDLFELERMEEAETDLARMTELAEELHLASHMQPAAEVAAGRAIMTGRWDDAERLSARALEAGYLLEGMDALMGHQAQLIGMAMYRGPAGDAISILQQYIGDEPWQLSFCGAMGYVCLLDGNLEEARTWMERLCADDLRPVRTGWEWRSVVHYLAEIAAETNDLRWVGPLYELIRPLTPCSNVVANMVLHHGATSGTGAVLAGLLGKRDESERLFEDALERNRRMEAPPLVARTLYAYARMLAQAEEASRAMPLLDEASGIATRFEMVDLLRQAGDLRSRTAPN